MDLLSLLKSANIFSPTGQMAPQQFPVGSIGGPVDPSSPSGQTGGLDLNAAIQSLLNPRDEQFNNFAQMIQSMPQRQDYQPDMLRRIGATIAGMGTGSPVGISGGSVLGYKSNIPEGMKVQQAIKDEPYNRALTDWANKLEPTEKIAQMEQNRNVGNRQTALGTLQRQQAQEKLDEQERASLEKERQGRDKIAIQQERADAYVKAKQFTQDHPEYKKFVDDEGNLVLYNPEDPTAEPIYPGVKQLSPMEKIDLQVQGELKKISARSVASKELEGAKQANRKEMEGVRQINRIGLKETPAPARPGTTVSGKPLSPSAERTAKQNKAIEIINEHPELEQYFIKGGNKIPTGELVPPKAGATDPGYNIAQRLMGQTGDIKLGSDINPQLNIAQPSSTPQSRELARPITESPQIKAARSKVEAGYVLITDGKSFGQIKPEDASKLPAGWSVVK